MVKVLFVCWGNICRSPMAESVMTHLIKENHLENRIEVYSAATSTEEIGNRPHYGTVGKLRDEGILLVPHRAVQMTKEDYDKYDYLIGMEDLNLRYMLRIVGSDPDNKIHKLMEYAGKNKDVADPWYTGDFDVTYNDVCEGCRGLLELLKKDILNEKTDII